MSDFRSITAAIIGVLLLAGCTDERPADDVPVQQTDNPIVDWTRQPTERSGTWDSVAVLTDVEASEGSDGERLEFTFQHSVPGFHAGYSADSVRQCGSGHPVTMSGSEVFTVRFAPAAAHTNGSSTLARRTLIPDASLVREMTIICDFEGNVAWAVGLKARPPYRVRTDSTRHRIILEFRR